MTVLGEEVHELDAAVLILAKRFFSQAKLGFQDGDPTVESEGVGHGLIEVEAL